MKKRKKPKVNPHKAKRVKASRPSMPPPSQPPLRLRLTKYQRWFLKTVVGVSVVLGIVASIAGIWGPFWPTTPSFSPGFPSIGLPLQIPFDVTNRSVLFPIKNLKINCLADIKTDDGNVATKNIIETGVSNSLQPSETRSYLCKFHESIHLGDGRIVEAQVEFLVEYHSRVPWKTLAKSTSGTFTLNTQTVPPQWMHGTPLH